MGDPSRCWALAWALLVLLWVPTAEPQGSVGSSWADAEAAKGSRRMDTAQHTIFIPPITVLPTMSPLNPAHNGRVCSTWGDFHYKTFDGDVFRFPGRCNYVFSAHCGAAYEDFNVQLRRGLAGSRPAITHVVLKAQGLVLEVSNGSVLIDGRREEPPYSRAGLLVERSSDYVKVSVRLVLTFMWNGEDSALLELDPKYANQTCGLCGDFNGLPAVNEFYAHNARLTPLQFGNLQKLDGPTEQCQDPQPGPADNCTDGEDICRRTLLGPAFAQCNQLVAADAYVAACAQDLCRCPTCPCATFAEYSRQCAHAGGQPQNWRGPDLCPRTCPLNMQHQECGSPCADTCSNPERAQLCEDHCVDGCFCPPGTVLDDVTNTGCLPLQRCPCTHGGRTYAPGASFTTSCSSCTCSRGLWQCQDLPCPGTCSIQGGSHISTYDEKLYDMHGDCSYVLSKKCADSGFTVLAELRTCGLTDNENCLKTVTLSMDGGDTVIRIQANGGVFMNSIYTQLPVSAANITMFRPSTFFILVQTGLGLQLEVQLVPLMQLVLRLDPAYRGQMCGLCGNFNQNQADDFLSLSGVVEGTAAAFANTWKTQATCPNVRNSFEDPCSLSVENENYAQHWCSLLTDPAGAFSPCHSIINPTPFHSNCLFDTCNCEKSEDCLCAALSAYVRACAARGVLLRGWRAGACAKYMSTCPKSQRYAYVVDGCQPTCRALGQADVTCGVAFVPVDGCTCPDGTFLDDAGSCVPAEACPCYFRGSVVAPGEVVHDHGVVCSCASGKLSCLGAVEQTTGCVAPMVYLDCSNASAGTPGAECLRSCQTLDVDCFSTHCVSGCVCPPGLVSDGSRGCVAEEDCPCLHNDAAYRPGDTIRVDCNTCTCRNRRWECSSRPCLGTCVAYGDGHFITFDGERYSFEGSCEYTLAQDYCGGNGSTSGTFRVVTENVPCGTTGVTCSKAIKLFLENYELILHEGTYKVLQRGLGADLPYRVRYMGTHLAIETRSGLVVSWDRRTSVFIRLRQDYKGRVCGLCGNFDDNAVNDFTTRGQSVVGDALVFGNSWKFSPTCPDAPAPRDPCTANPYRKAWAQRQCSLIHSAAFRACHAQVDSTKYYEACVSDACACDSGGDCECFCTAVAAYAQACRDAGVCVAWRTPDICPLFCDYYNPRGECEWHYQPCGAPCLKTCRNPSGRCLMDLPGQEGCYPKCPPSKPFFSEDQMRCVAQCGCYDDDGSYYDVGTKVPTAENCQSCDCTPGGLRCTYSLEACECTYEGRTYGFGEVIYNTSDGLGACLMAICGSNGTITRRVLECPETPSTTPFTFTSTATPPSTTGPVPTLSTVCVRELCHWSAWYDSGRPEPGMGGGDFETLANLRQRGHQVCPAPARVECRAQLLPDTPLEQLGQKVECSPLLGLRCLNSEQDPPLCHNYELRVLCCDYVPCGTPPGPTASQKPTPPPPGTLPVRATTAWTSPTTEPRSASSSETPGPTCQPRCQWTEWFDEDYPKSEEAGGDIESYDRIRSAGGAVCERPQDIECRAVNFPDRRPEELGQLVHCDPSFGLVCRNDEQMGLFKMCYNYRIRLLCCSHSHCGQPTPATASAATATATATATASSTTVTTTTATTPATASAVTATPSSTTTTATVTPATASTATASSMTVTTTTATTPATASAVTATPSSTTTTATVTPATASTATATATTSSMTTTATPATASAATATATAIASSTTATASSATTSAATATATRSSTTTTTTTAIPATATTTSTATATTAATSSLGTPGCAPRCEWTEWFDVDFPTSGVTGGDMETYDNIRAAGGKMCREPRKIECRAESYPEVSLDQIGQVVSCSLQAGLVCRNRDQRGPFTMCFNYNVRVLCCDSAGRCPTSATPPPGPPTGNLATTAQPASSSAPHTATLATSPRQTTTGSSATRSTIGTSPPSSSWKPSSVSPTPTSPTSGACVPQCTWTDWFDVDYPSPGPSGGDFETYANIREAGRLVCERPVDLECQATSLPDLPLRQLGQVVQCRLETGLVCRNRDQDGWFRMCLNYRIRVLCCDDYRHCPSTAMPASTGPRTSGATELRTTATTESLPSSPRTTGRVTGHTAETGPSTASTTESVPPTQTARTSLRTTESVPPTQTARTSLSTTEWPSVPSRSASPGTLTTTAKPASSGAPHTVPLVTTPSQTTPGIPSSRPTFGTTLPTSSLKPTMTSMTSTPSMTSTTPGACTPRCRWTDWFDEDYPTAGPDGGDFETLSVLRSAGHDLCEQPQDIECRSEKAPGASLEDVGQVVRCDVRFGLVCRNRDQGGRFRMCLNYRVRLLCCDDYRHCPSPPPGSTLAPGTPTTTATSSPGPRTRASPSPLIPATTSSPLGTTPGPSTAATMATGSTVKVRTSPITTPSPVTSVATPTACQPRCAWSGWLDQSYPMPGASGGDFETYANMRAAGRPICERPEGLECRAERLPDVPLEQLGQVVQCRLETGLVCRNRDQNGRFKMCFNYQIRVLCCDDYRHCPGTATPTSTGPRTPMATELRTTATTESLPSSPGTTGRVTGRTAETGPSTASTTESVPPTQTARTSLSTTESVAPTQTARTSLRTTESVAPTQTARTSLRTTESVAPTQKARTSLRTTESVPPTQTARTSLRTTESVAPTQTARTSLRTTESVAPTQKARTSLRTTESVPPTQTARTSLRTTESVAPTQKARTSLRTTESVPPTQTARTSLRTTESVAPTQTARTSLRTTESVPPTQTARTSLRTTESVPPTQTARTSLSTTEWPSVPSRSASPGTLTTTGQPASSSAPHTATLATSPRQTTTGSSATRSTIGTSPPSSSWKPSSVSPTPTSPTSGACVPQCTWTDWFDVHYPSPGPSGGDFETYANIREAGRLVCERPVDLECQATSLPDLPLRQLGQVVQCRLETGLVCRNRDQDGWFRMCLNYRIRVLCCDDYRHCPSTAMPASTGPRTSGATELRTTATTESLPSSPRTTGRVTGHTAETGPSTASTTESVPPTQTARTSLRTTEWPSVPSRSASPGTLTTTAKPASSGAPHTVSLVTTPRQTTPGIPSSRPTFGTTLPTSSLKPTMTSMTSTPSMTSTTPGACTPRCRWTDWFDEDYPTAGPDGGDFETLSVLRSAGHDLCEQPQDIECRSEKAPGASLEDVGQVVRCDVRFGLVCRNRDQGGRFRMCLNYRVRLLCCDDYRHCPSSPGTTAAPSPPPGSTLAPGTPTTTATSSPGPRTRASPSPPIPATTSSPLGTTLGPSTAATMATGSTVKVRTSPITTPSPVTSVATPTACQPRCAWSGWLDQSYPMPGASGGDFETYANMRAAGRPVCERPEGLECRAERLPDVPLEQLGQVVQCRLETGLVCRNRDQDGRFKMCFNYQIRVLCCDDYRHCPGTATPTSTGPRTPMATELRTTATTESLPSSPGTTGRVTSRTAETGPSTASTTESVPPTQTARISLRTTESVPPTQTARISLRTTESVPPTQTARTSLRTTESVPPTQTARTSLSTTEWPSVPSRSASPGTLTTTAKPASSGAPHTVPLVTTPRQTTPGIPSSRPTFGTTLPTSSLKPTMTSMTSTPSMTSTTPGACTPRCRWTDWFDEDYPTAGPDGGDFETLSVLRSAGHDFCEQPQDIECRSEKAPGASLEDVGQVVRCDVRFGLVCRNRDQGGRFRMCLNYRVRLLCCDDYRHCPSSPGTTAVSVPSTLGPSASPSPPAATTPCRCRAFGQLFSPGDVVYNRTDGAGCRFYAICNQQCELDRFQGACPTASPEPPTATWVPLTSPAPGCDLADPPRQVNESWTLEDCTVARCEGDNRIVLLEPQPVAQVSCVNGHLPVKVQSQQEPCRFHYECECSCSSWGDSHYVTFDGTPYSFRDNCTHVLMREIRPRHGNLTILLDNHHCGAVAAASASCPRALRIRYASTEAVLTTETAASGQEEGLILLDGVRVSQGFSQSGVSVSVAASTTMRVDIPAVGVSITFDGQAFQVQLPYSRFSHNTEGQCGTCTNSKTDDCRLPDGTIAPTCQDMASAWLVPETNKEGCWAPTGPPATTSVPSPAPTMPTSTPCPPAPLCELMLSHIFAECHDLISPGLFFSACVQDACQAGHPGVPCQSLEAYAALCRARGACSDWRNATGGLCELPCPPEKVYKPCGPLQPASCDSRTQSPESTGLAEGCFCPDGQTLFNAHTDVCVPECPCVGPDGFPKFPGERWVSNCQACVCDAGSVSVQCAPVQCDAQELPRECGWAGFVAVTRPLADNPCCQETLCVCNTTSCPQSPPACGPGEELARAQEEGGCCPTFSCRPKLCTYNGTVYGVGATFPATTPCHTCTCLSVDAQDPTVQCEEDSCHETCAPGSEYLTVAGQCCGECVQRACLTPDGGLVQPNETWVHSLDSCTEYHCQAEHGVPMLILRPSPCPDVSSCRGILRKTGCCYSCEEVDSCQVRVNRTVLGLQGCEAPVNLTFCEGSCPGASRYSPEAQAMQRRCTCCQETRAHEEAVTLQCPDGTAVRHTYTHIDECRCDLACVPSPAAPEHGHGSYA